MTPRSNRSANALTEPKFGGLSVAVLASAFLHVAAIAALIYMTKADAEPLPPTAVTLDVGGMSPNPGGQENVGSSDSGSVAASTATPASKSEAHEPSTAEASPDATNQMEHVETDPSTQQSPIPQSQMDVKETVEAKPTTEIATIDVIDESPPVPTQDLVFETPPKRPEAPPSHAPLPSKEAVPQKALSLSKSAISQLPEMAELAGIAAMATGSELAAAGSPGHEVASGMKGWGSGVAGYHQGPRFQLGAPGNPLPKYPDRARRNGFEGRVVLAVQVSGDGKPLSVRIASSSGFGILDRAALRTIRRWQFLPVVGVENRHVAEVKIPITFKLQE